MWRGGRGRPGIGARRGFAAFRPPFRPRLARPLPHECGGRVMAGITVRPLEAGDRAAWGLLWEAYLAFYRTTLPPEVFEAQFARLLAGDPFFGLVAADVAGRSVGLCHCILHGHGWRLERVVYLQDLFVGEAARGLGAGRALIEGAYAEADRRGAPHVYWLTEDSNATARLLYDRVARHTPFTRYVRPL